MPYIPPKIDLSEEFEHLANAPITEAVCEIRGAATAPWEAADITSRLKAALPEYPIIEARQEVTFGIHIKAEQLGGEAKPQKPMTPVQGKAQWQGLQMKPADSKKVAFFKNTAFSYTMLKPYSHWKDFYGEAWRLWKIHRELAKVEQIQRLGLRFINQIPLPTEPWELSDYLVIAPPDPNGIALPFSTFVHQDVWAVPNYRYQINCIRTIRPPTDAQSIPTLFIDLDVSTIDAPVHGDIETKLLEMRWLKNKLFFGIVTEKTLSLLR